MSKTRLLAQVRAHDVDGVAATLAAKPELLGHRDERGRGWLHVCCMVAPADDGAASIALADRLLAAGLGLDDAAFTEGERWQATPLWHAVSRGRNPALIAHLLGLGANPDFCLFAAAYNDDPATIDALVAAGATVDDASFPGETPFLGAVGWSRFRCAVRLLEHGADVDTTDRHGRTALHLMLAKGSDVEHLEALVPFGPRGDLADDAGRTAADVLRRKRDPRFRALADRLRSSAG